MNRQFLAIAKRVLFPFILICLTLFCFKLLAPSFAQRDEEREIENKIPKHVPLKVEIKKDKHEKIKDLKNDEWVRDFELEVTNTSDKPIYFLNLYVLLPDLVSQNGGVVGMPLRYGRMSFINYETKSLADDVPIKPGESYSFKIPETDQKGWYARRASGDVVNPRRIQLIFSNLSFGDGTGFTGTTAVPYPRNKEQSQDPPTPRGLGQNSHAIGNYDCVAGFPDLLLRQPSLDTKPAAFLPVRFFESTSVNAAAPQGGLCCPGTQCSFLKASTYQCVCGEAVTVETASCSDPAGWCATAQLVDRVCTEFGIGCPEYVLNTDCNIPQPTPTPTPTPAPTPVPCPATPPSSCATGIPVDNCTWDNPPGIPDGCKPFYQPDPTGFCCVPEQQPPCPEDCPSGGSAFPADPCTYAWPDDGCPDGATALGGGCCGPTSVSPIIIDIDGAGFNMSSAADGVWFDFFDTGSRIKISWTANYSTNSFLVLDRNGNGTIDHGKELFGNLTPQSPSSGANGFLALAEYDRPIRGGKRDGVINRQDAIFTSLRLWQDANHNGFSEPSELRTFSEVGLKTIDLDYKESRRTDQYGNQFRYRAKVKDTHDAQLGRGAWDVFLVVSP